MARFNAENARKVLENCAPESEFWVCNNQRLKNLNELADAFQSMEENVFAAHSNLEKRDFSNWVNDVLGDAELAKQLATTDKKKALSAVLRRIKQLNQLAAEKQKPAQKARPQRRK